MKPVNGELTAEELRSRLHYDPETGVFTWKVKVHRSSLKVGDVAGTTRKDGYVQIMIRRKLYMAHRLAWLYMTGEWPDDLIDHRNTIKDDNRWVNLRSATMSENMRNVGLLTSNKSGYRGVSRHTASGKWQAHIFINKRHIYLGLFPTKEEAADAYAEAAKKYHGEFVHKSHTTRIAS